MINKKKKVLIVSSYCFQKASANGICARSLYNEFVSRGYETHILGVGDESDVNDKEFAISDVVPKKIKFKRLAAAFRMLKSVFVPSENRDRVERYYKKLKELNEKHQFDLIVAMYFPMEIVSAVARLKKENKAFKFAIYELDSATDGINRFDKKVLGKLAFKANVRWCENKYKLADTICVMNGHLKHFDELYGKQFGTKMKLVDLPLLCDNTVCNSNNETQQVEFAYMGELNTNYRSPKILLDTLANTTTCSNWSIHFYSKGDCEALLKQYEESDSRIHSHGYVDQKALLEVYNKTNFFISIGNAHSNSVPSKIINYISLGKPIIHFCLQENDVCEEYFEKYPLALVIKKGESPEVAADKIKEFVEAICGKTVLFEDLCKLLPMNLPSYSVSAILF